MTELFIVIDNHGQIEKIKKLNESHFGSIKTLQREGCQRGFTDYQSFGICGIMYHPDGRTMYAEFCETEDINKTEI